MSEVNNFSGGGQGKIHHINFSKEKVTPLPKKRVVTSEKVAAIEEVDKGTKTLYVIKEAVFMIRRKDLDNFDGQSKGSTG